MNWIIKLLTNYPFVFGLSIRIFIAWFLPLLLDDAGIVPGVAYTDIDYRIFTDAAEYIRNGESPFKRHTYRYTPFLALILSKVNGRYLFCVADALCGKLILQLQALQRDTKKKSASAPTLRSCCMWMYNPLAINICTRGSAESFVVLLPVLLTVAVTTSQKIASIHTRALLAGILHGISVHAKVYPIIYSLSFMAYFGRASATSNSSSSTPIKSFLSFLSIWIRRLLHPAPLLFAGTFIFTFGALTYAAVYCYGRVALDEGLLYHLSRVDHRHNYSMWWYPIYLAKRKTPGIVLLLPQALLLLVTSLGFDDLGFTLFCQTYLFVTLNKVITAQYFTWYLCLLPLCSTRLEFSPRLGRATAFVLISVVLWLGSAYLLELQGLPVHRLVWMASVVYFCANIHLLRVLIQAHADGSKKKRMKAS